MVESDWVPLPVPYGAQGSKLHPMLVVRPWNSNGYWIVPLHFADSSSGSLDKIRHPRFNHVHSYFCSSFGHIHTVLGQTPSITEYKRIQYMTYSSDTDCVSFFLNLCLGAVAHRITYFPFCELRGTRIPSAPGSPRRRSGGRWAGAPKNQSLIRSYQAATIGLVNDQILA